MIEGVIGSEYDLNIGNILLRNDQENESRNKLMSFLKDNDIKAWHKKDYWCKIYGCNQYCPLYRTTEVYKGQNKMIWFRGGFECGVHDRSKNVPQIGDKLAILENIQFICGSKPQKPSYAYILKVKEATFSLDALTYTFHDEFETKKYFFDVKNDCYSWYIEEADSNNMKSLFWRIIYSCTNYYKK